VGGGSLLRIGVLGIVTLIMVAIIIDTFTCVVEVEVKARTSPCSAWAVVEIFLLALLIIVANILYIHAFIAESPFSLFASGYLMFTISMFVAGLKLASGASGCEVEIYYRLAMLGLFMLTLWLLDRVIKEKTGEGIIS